MSNEKQIRQFCQFFRNGIEIISNIMGDPNDPEYGSTAAAERRDFGKTLVVTLLDGIAGIKFSKSRYPDIHSKNRERFIRFITEHGNWPEGDLVSLPILLNRLTGESPSASLRVYVEKSLAKEDLDSEPSLAITVFDKPPEHLLQYAETNRQKRLIEKTQHLSLLYSYRSFLIHEFRAPGYGIGAMCNDPEAPCYHQYIGEKGWQLTYPAGFFLKLARTCVASIENFFLHSDLNPYEDVADTSDW